VAQVRIPPVVGEPDPQPFTTPSAFRSRATPGRGGGSAAASRSAADASARADEALEKENALVEARITAEERYAAALKVLRPPRSGCVSRKMRAPRR
jgi:hypothetical protein